MLASSPRWLLEQKGFGQRGWQSGRRLTLPLKEGSVGEHRFLLGISSCTLYSCSESQSKLQFLVSLRVLGAQISKQEIRNVQSLFKDFLEFGALWFLLFGKGFGCLFIIQCRLMSSFLGAWPTFLVPLASLAQQGSFRASSQHPVWEWPSFLRLLGSESLLKWPSAQEGPLWRLARENSPGF